MTNSNNQQKFEPGVLASYISWEVVIFGSPKIPPRPLQCSNHRPGGPGGVGWGHPPPIWYSNIYFPAGATTPAGASQLTDRRGTEPLFPYPAIDIGYGNTTFGRLARAPADFGRGVVFREVRAPGARRGEPRNTANMRNTRRWFLFGRRELRF